MQNHLAPDNTRHTRRDEALGLLSCACRRRGASPDPSAWYGAMRHCLAAGRALTVLEHTTLAFLARSQADGTTCAGLQTMLVQSWEHLVGSAAGCNPAMDRLPRRVLRRATREERLLHAASFRSAPVTGPGSLRELVPDYVPELLDFVPLAVGCGMVLLVGNAALLGMAALGYLVATLAEYAMHRWAGHEGDQLMRPALDRLGSIGRWAGQSLTAIRFGHFVLHHARTSNRYYTTQFGSRPPFDQATIDAELAELGATGRYAKASDYGMSLGHSGVALALLAPFPVHLLLIWVLSPGPAGIAALTLPALLYVAASKSLHRYLHRSPEHAMATAGPFMRWVLRTRYAEWVSRCHWIHHKGGGGNYNLMPGADLLLRDYRRPDLNTVFRMRADRILGAWWTPV